VLLGAALLVSLAASFTSGSVWDDSYMFLRYSRSITLTGTPSFNAGSGPSFGVTSPLHLLVVNGLDRLLPGQPVIVLLLSSTIAGMLFLYLSWKIASRARSHAPPLVLLLLASFALASGVLAAHFTSGMDTMLAMAAVTLAILLYGMGIRSRGVTWAAVTGVWAGLCFSVRPDILVLTLGLPFFTLLLPGGKGEKRFALAVLAVALVTLLVQLAICRSLFGYWIPLSSFVKSPGFYGGAISRAYLLVPVTELGRFLVSFPLLFALPIVDLVMSRRSSFAGSSVQARAALLSAAVYTAVMCCLVTQIMGADCRFYMPVLPVLVYLAAGSLSSVTGSIGERGTFRLDAVVSRGAKALLLVLAAFAALGSVQRSASFVRHSGSGAFNFSLESEYLLRWTGYWKGLDTVAGLPDDLVIAATEVGVLSAMNPGKYVLDMSGLNTPLIALGEETPVEALVRTAPDLVYMPHPDYGEMNGEIEGSEWFRMNYLYLPGDSIGAQLSVGVRADSPYREELLSAMGGGAGGLPPGRRGLR
jgi:hypothetical protein